MGGKAEGSGSQESVLWGDQLQQGQLGTCWKRWFQGPTSHLLNRKLGLLLCNTFLSPDMSWPQPQIKRISPTGYTNLSSLLGKSLEGI